MQKKQLLIASVLKPVDDHRMFEKLGLSLSKINGFQINIAGFDGKIPDVPNINFYPLFSFHRLNLSKRRSVSSAFYSFLVNIQPDLIIIETHELLAPCIKYKEKYGCKLIYDLRENYYLNIKFGSGFPSIIRSWLADRVRKKEVYASSQMDHFILSDEVYQQQLTSFNMDFTMMPNYLAALSIPKGEIMVRDPFRVLFTGTVAYQTGIMEALRLIRSLHAFDNRYHLKVLGNCHDKKLFKRLSVEFGGLEYVKLPDSTNLIPHSKIITEIQKSGFGFIHYHNLQQINGKTPTKFYEYAGLGLPMIILNTDNCISIPKGTKGAIFINNTEDISEIKYPDVLDPAIQFHWDQNEKVLQNLITRLI